MEDVEDMEDRRYVLINFIFMPGLQKLDRRVAVLCSLRIRQHLAVIHNSLCKLGGVGYARGMKGV